MKKRLFIYIFFIVSLAIFMTAGYAAQSACDGSDPWDLWTSGTCLRGANIYQQEKSGDPWYPELVAQDFIDLRAAGANYVNLSVPGPYDVVTFEHRSDFMAALDELVLWAENAGLFAVISFRTGPGRGEYDITEDGINNRDIFDNNDEAKAAYAAMWQEVAERYRDHNHIVGYDIMVEPHHVEHNNSQIDNRRREEFKRTWTGIATTVVNAIREVDSITPVLVSPPDWGVASSLEEWQPLPGDRIVTTVHQYEPYGYTHENENLDWTLKLDEVMSTIADWKATTGQPVAVNEFGVKHSVTDAEKYIAQELDLLEAAGYNHAVWLWEVADPAYTFRDFDVKKDPALLAELTDRWVLNSAFPKKSDHTSCGKPSFMPGQEAVVAVWQDCATGQWSFRFTAGGSENTVNYSGSLTSDTGISAWNPWQLEQSDSLTANGSNLMFNMRVVRNGSDGFDITLPEGAVACLSYTHQSPDVVIGRSRLKRSGGFTSPSLGDCL